MTPSATPAHDAERVTGPDTPTNHHRKDTTMQLQFAMDTLTTEDALDLAGKAAPYVDVIELGTPLIKSAGLSAITAVKEAHPDKVVFADLKTMDAGELEADIAFSAGADLVTVLGVAGDSTIAGAVKAAKAHGKGIVVDLIGVEDKAARAKEVVALGAEFVEMHAGLDEQAEEGFTFETLLRDGEASGVPFSVAGGIKPDTIASVQASGARIAVAGSAIYSADDVAAAAAELRAAITADDAA
jgi:3-hexulose-6-phosphate synthase